MRASWKHGMQNGFDEESVAASYAGGTAAVCERVPSDAGDERAVKYHQLRRFYPDRESEWDRWKDLYPDGAGLTPSKKMQKEIFTKEETVIRSHGDIVGR